MFAALTDYLVYGLLGLNQSDKLANTFHFFIYDSVKILVLLFLMISAIGVLRSFVSPCKIRQWTEGKNKLISAFLASTFGVLTPFCSCSSIPVFLSFIRAGVPLGTAFSFLITSPLVNEYLVVLMLSFFGAKITLIYVASGMVIGITSGLILGALKLEPHLEKDFQNPNDPCATEMNFPNFKSRLKYGLGEGKDILFKIWKWILLGVAIGSLIHNYVPQETIMKITTVAGPFTVPLATILGVPMYGGCASIVPVAVALFNKGAPLGTALAFMMAVAALSLPEGIILRRAMKLKLILIFFSIVFLGIVLIGYFINFIY
ncbi:MAG TPA: permease [Elusimicrobiales bacterium]|nr:permease [Elusimicrobiales bacterium]